MTSGDSTIIVREQVPILITVEGTITSVEQYKNASSTVYASLRTTAGHRAGEWSACKTIWWSNRYETCSGDTRALPRTCWGMASMYPSSWTILDDLGAQLKDELFGKIVAGIP